MTFFPYVGHKWTRHRSFLRGTSKLTSLYYEINTAEISENETFFSEIVVYQGTTFNEKWESAILDVKTHFKRKPYSIYIFTSYNPPIVKAPVWQTRSLENPTNKLLWGSISDFKKRLMDRGWPHNFEIKIAIRSKTHRRKAALLKQNNKEEKEILPFVTQYQPLVSNYKRSFTVKPGQAFPSLTN